MFRNNNCNGVWYMNEKSLHLLNFVVDDGIYLQVSWQFDNLRTYNSLMCLTFTWNPDFSQLEGGDNIPLNGNPFEKGKFEPGGMIAGLPKWWPLRTHGIHVGSHLWLLAVPLSILELLGTRTRTLKYTICIFIVTPVVWCVVDKAHSLTSHIN